MKNWLLVTALFTFGCKGKTSDGDSTPPTDDSNETGTPPLELSLASTSFEAGGDIGLKHVCSAHGGENISPELHWENAPDGVTFALVMDDEVSPCGKKDNACRHWGLFNLPASTTSIAEDLDPSTIEGLVVGNNYAGEATYAGPCPPNAHVYKFSLYALSEDMPAVEAPASLTRSQFEAQYSDSIVSQVTIEGLFDPASE